jgi:predicted RNA-binding Zn ribbon-like protein
MMQRPLTGEPLCLDLVNTRWIDGGLPKDVLDGPGGAEEWVTGHGYDADATEGLREARDALHAVLEMGEPAPLNAVLAWGRCTPVLTADGPGEVATIESGRRAAWDAARDYLRLLASAPERIRRCAHPACVLWFHDTSRNGTRRWCSMEACGNRAKAGRYYRRTHPS